jgi:hypothetical protein
MKQEEPDEEDADDEADDEVIEVPLFLEKIEVINKSFWVIAFNNHVKSDNDCIRTEFITL